MSDPRMFNRRTPPAFAGIPRGESVASFGSYEAAQAAVASLAHADFPVREVSIIGSDLKSVERVTGKLSYGRAAGAGAISGAWLGLFLGLVLIIFNPTTEIVLVGAAVLMGAAFGMLFGIVSYSVTRRRRDYTSATLVVASTYEVIVGPELANRARNLLESAGSGSSQP
ncbi:general stress protein [Plantibacter sp. Mn2098]|uniref:general stress protein n=1 Tax=Plantibacter sp. Mn2098 TaxID=3395266 RepID=UPI003BC0A065